MAPLAPGEGNRRSWQSSAPAAQARNMLQLCDTTALFLATTFPVSPRPVSLALPCRNVQTAMFPIPAPYVTWSQTKVYLVLAPECRHDFFFRSSRTFASWGHDMTSPREGAFSSLLTAQLFVVVKRLSSTQPHHVQWLSVPMANRKPSA